MLTICFVIAPLSIFFIHYTLLYVKDIVEILDLPRAWAIRCTIPSSPNSLSFWSKANFIIYILNRDEQEKLWDALIAKFIVLGTLTMFRNMHLILVLQFASNTVMKEVSKG